MRSRFGDILLLVLANLLWGSTDVVGKFAIEEMSPEALAWTRFTIAFLAFLPVLYVRRAEIPRTVKGLLPFVALGASAFFINFVLHYHGLSLAPASHATALRVSESLAIVFFSALILRERIGRLTIVGLAMGVVGVAMVLDVDVKNLSLFASGYRLGDLLIICGIMIEAQYTVFGKKVLVKTRPFTATALACGFGWIMLTVCYGPGIAQEFSRGLPSAAAFASCAYLGLIATVIAFWIYYRVLAKRESNRVGISIMVQPVVGIPLAALVLREPITKGFILGSIFIAVGVYLALGGNLNGASTNMKPVKDNGS